MSQVSRIRNRLVREGREPTLGNIFDELFGREGNPLRHPPDVSLPAEADEEDADDAL